MSAHSFNVARRLSARVEPDLLPKIHLESSLPTECVQLYPGLLTNLRRRLSGTKNDHAIAFAGMGPGEAAAAMAAREKGQLSHAQIQRRFTKKSSR
eukprot:13309302-Ditylum_brightwellii.AAC.1